MRRVETTKDFKLQRVVASDSLSSSVILTRLSVGKDASVVTSEGIVEDVLPHCREHCLLGGEGGTFAGQGVETVVESECFGLLATVKEREEHC